MSEFDFDAAMAAKGLGPETTQEEVVSEAPPAEVPSPEVEASAPADRPRDDKGRFAAEEKPAELILGKFRSTDDLVQAYQEAERRLGQQGSEVGDLRRQVDDLRQRVTSAPQSVDQQTVEALDQLAESSPAEAANWVLQYAPNAPHLYDRVMETWFQNDPRGASRYESWHMVQQAQRDIQDRIAPALQPVQEQLAEQQFAQAWSSVARKYPDLPQYQDAMIELANRVPEVADALMKGDAAAKEARIENLLWMARGQQADHVATAAAEQARESATQAAAEKVAATVASASSGAARGGDNDRIAEWKKAAFLTPEPTNIWTTSS